MAKQTVIIKLKSFEELTGRKLDGLGDPKHYKIDEMAGTLSDFSEHVRRLMETSNNEQNISDKH